jgi:hypothetical protein
VVQDCCAIVGVAELLEVGGGRGVGGLQFLLGRVRGGGDCDGAVLETSGQGNGVGEIAVPDGQDVCLGGHLLVSLYLYSLSIQVTTSRSQKCSMFLQ